MEALVDKDLGVSCVSDPVSGEKVATDSKTGLMWQGSYAKGMIWEEAQRYSKSLSYGGYSDWRLPTRKELESLEPQFFEILGAGFPEMSLERFWSSSCGSSATELKWCVRFSPPPLLPHHLISLNDKDYPHAVRCVRGGS